MSSTNSKAAFFLLSAETEEKNAKKSIERGFYGDAVKSYRRAIGQLNKAIDADAENAERYALKVRLLEGQIADLENGAVAAKPVSAGPFKGEQTPTIAQPKPTTQKPSPVPTAAPQGPKRMLKDLDFDAIRDEYPKLNFANPNKKIYFDDIIGLKKAKDAIHKLLIYPLQSPDSFREYDLSAGGMILMEGPPGTGKTTFAKAAACQIELPFVEVSCTSLVDSYIGNSAKNVEALFAELRRFVREQNTSVLVFFDEFDAIAKIRSGENKTAQEVVPALIRELDGFDSNNNDIIILAATNLKDQLDSAVLSRFTKSLNIPLPDHDARKEMFIAKLKKEAKFTDEDLKTINLDLLAKESEGMSGRDLTNILLEFRMMLAMAHANIEQLKSSYEETLLRLVQERRNG